jgi:hypothetical protein
MGGLDCFVSTIQDSKSEGVDVASVEELYLVGNEGVGTKLRDEGP